MSAQDRRTQNSTLRLALPIAILGGVIALQAGDAWCVAADLPSATAPLIDRGLQQPLVMARSLVGRGQFAEAVRSVQPLLTDRQNTLVFVDGRYIDAKVAANQLIASLPADARSLYEREFGGVARRELQDAESAGRLDRILAVAVAYRHTEAGRQALAAAAGLFFDGGQFVEAAAVARELLETPASQESAAAARLVAARLKLGQAAEARQWVERRRDFLSHRDIEIGGTKRRLDQWLLESIHQDEVAQGASRAGVSGGHPQMIAPGHFDRPSAQPLWIKRCESAGVAASLAQELIQRRVESGIAPVFHSVPLVIGQTLVVRRDDELAAYDLRGGATRWSIDIAPANSSSIESETLAERAFSGGPHSALSTDGEHVFTVVEDAVPYVRPDFALRGRRMHVELPSKNSLSAFELQGGKRLWQLAEIQPLAPAATAEQRDRDVDFLGPPLFCGGTLYVLGRTNEGANLLALDPADGSVRWGKSLAGFSGFETDGTAPFGPACIPVERDGLLICPTPEGIVIAVDLATRTCRWAYRAQPTEEPSGMPPRWGRRFPAVEARWLNAWRENLVRLDDRHCFFVSPRSSAIHALAIDSGRVLWTQSVAKGLFLGPIVDGRLLAISQYRALAFDAESGKLLWSSAIGLPTGRGFASQGRYLLPQLEGGMAAIDVESGVVDFPASGKAARLGNLVPLANAGAAAAVSQSHDQLALLPSLDGMRALAALNLRRHPADGGAERKVAQFAREAGDFENAERLYGKLLEAGASDKVSAVPPPRLQITRKVSPSDQEPIRGVQPQKSRAEMLLLEEDNREKLSIADQRALFDILIADIERTPQHCFQRSPQLLRVAAGDERRAFALRTVGKALAGQGERLLGLEALLELARVELPSQFEVDRGPKRLVAFDRQLAADLLDLLRACSPPERQQANLRIERALARARDQGDVGLFDRVFQRLRRTGLDRARLRTFEAALRPDSAFSQTQIELWEAATCGDAHRAAEAWRDLAEFSRSHGNLRQAALCYRRLAADFSDMRFDDGLRPTDLVAAAKDDRPFLREIEDAERDPWPATPPDAMPDSDSGSSAQFFHLPVETVPGSLCERLDVALDHQGDTLRFQGNGQPTYWDLRLPAENFRFRGIPFHRAWGVGPFVVVQAGTDLFGVTPLDEGGEPVPALLWHVDLFGPALASGRDFDIRFIPGALAIAGERILMTDRLGRPVARVGPVRPGYVCYQDRGSLVAIDPLSGRLLWRRTDVPAADLTAGDDSLILLVDRRSKRLQFLRALDGKTVAERTIATASDFRWLEGLDALTQASQSHRVQLSRINLLNGQAKWVQSFPADTQFVRLDARRYVAAEAGGTFHVLDAERGTVMATSHLPQVKHCVQVHVTGDERRFYLAFSGTFADARNFRANGQRDESRNPLVSGALCAVDRRSGRTLWNRSFLDGVFSLDQSRVAPMLVFSYRQYRRAGADDDDNEAAWPILHCIDKRTGRDVFKERFGSGQPAARTFAEVELGRHEVIVRCPDGSMRFRYSH